MDVGLGISTSQVPNSFTPLAWLPPDAATEFENMRYLLLGILGVRALLCSCAALRPQMTLAPQAWLWDVITSFSEEYSTLFTGYKVKFPDVVYVLSRCAPSYHCVLTIFGSDMIVYIRIITGCFLLTTVVLASALRIMT